MIRAIAVDDEPRALDVISILALKVPGVNIVESFTDPAEALEFLKSNYVDVIFLDINMPEISGIQLIKKLSFKPHIIFTTAYSEYALESYEYEVVDYLLKPIELDRFRKAIDKVDRLLKLHSVESYKKEGRKLFFKDGYRNIRVDTNDILFIKGEGNYLNLVCETSKSMIRMTFDELLSRLPEKDFLRIHNSYIINLRHIVSLEDNHVNIGENKISVGTKYKTKLESYVSRNS